jgi:hypothetical protein
MVSCYTPHVLTSYLTGELTAVGISSADWQGYNNFIRTADETYYEKGGIISYFTVTVIISQRK